MNIFGYNTRFYYTDKWDFDFRPFFIFVGWAIIITLMVLGWIINGLTLLNKPEEFFSVFMYTLFIGLWVTIPIFFIFWLIGHLVIEKNTET